MNDNDKKIKKDTIHFNKQFDYLVLDAYNRLQLIGFDVTLESLLIALKNHVSSSNKLLNKYLIISKKNER